MGNNPSTSSSSTTPQQVQTSKPNFSATYQLVKKIDDPLYGEIRIVRDIKTGEIIYLKEIIVNNFEDFQAESKVYNQRIAVSHPNVVRILGYNAPNEPNPISGYYKISVYIEVLQKTLADELNVRLETGIPFGENDILLVAESLIAALSYFETQNIFHGDVRPANIFVSRHAYKLSDPYLKTKRNANALSLAIINEPETVPLLSPQLLVQVPHQDFEIRCKKNKADVFSLGATLLSLASLSKSEELYDYDYGTFDLDLMKERLEKVRKNFSKFTYELIRDMLRLPEDSRPDFNTLATRLRPFQDDIVKKGELPFFAQRAPYEDNDEDDDYYIQLFRQNEQLKARSKVSPQKAPVQASPYRGVQQQGGYEQDYDYDHHHHVQRESPQQQRYSHQQQQQQRYSPAQGGYDQGSGENVYTVNLEDEDYQYGHHDDGLDFNYTEGAHAHERASHSQSPNRYQDRGSYRDDMMPVQQSISPEKNMKRANPQIYVEAQRSSHIVQYAQEDLKRSSPQQFRQSQVVQQSTNKIYIDINQQQYLLQQQQVIYQQQLQEQQRVQREQEQQRIQHEQEQARLRQQQQEQQYYLQQAQAQAQNYRPPVQPVQNAQTVNIMTLDKPDELEARIKAALSRSQTTYQAAVSSASQSQVAHTPQHDPLRGSQTYGAGQQSLGGYLTQQQTASYQPVNVNTTANYAAVPKDQHLAHSYTATTTTTNVPGGYQSTVSGDNYNYGTYTVGGGQTAPGSYLASGTNYASNPYGVPSTHTH